jgi:hypothetical protein
MHILCRSWFEFHFLVVTYYAAALRGGRQKMQSATRKLPMTRAARNSPEHDSTSNNANCFMNITTTASIVWEERSGLALFNITVTAFPSPEQRAS